MKSLVVIFSPLHSALWILPAAMDFIFCYCLYKLFKLWTDSFREKCPLGISTEDFAKECRIHQKICHLVGHADDFLSLHKASSFLCNSAGVLFLLYNLIYSPGFTTTEYIVTFIWLSGALGNLILTCFSGAIVNHVVSTCSCFI